MMNNNSRQEFYDLEIAVLEGVGLAAKDKTWYGKKLTSDPFVEVRLCSFGEDTPPQDKVYLGKTNPVMKTLDPVWDPLSFNVSLPTHYFSKEGSYFEVTVLDWNPEGDSELMGVVPVFIPTQHHSVAQGEPLTTTKLYNIPPDSANGKKAKGSILCTIEIQKVTKDEGEEEKEPEESESEEAEEEEEDKEEQDKPVKVDNGRRKLARSLLKTARKSIAVRSQSVMLQKALSGRIKPEPEDNNDNPASSNPNTTSSTIPSSSRTIMTTATTTTTTANVEMIDLELTVVQAKGLLAMDTNFFGFKTTSDPYVEVRLCPIGPLQPEETKIFLGKTRIEMKTLEPKWEETFTKTSIPKKDFTQYALLELKIWDWDEDSTTGMGGKNTGDDDLMGIVQIHVPIARSGTTRKWYDIPRSTAEGNEEATGQIECILTTNKRRVVQQQQQQRAISGVGESSRSTLAGGAMKPSYKMMDAVAVPPESRVSDTTETTALTAAAVAADRTDTTAIKEGDKPTPVRSTDISDNKDENEEEIPKNSASRRQRRAERKRVGTDAPVRRNNTSSGSLGSKAVGDSGALRRNMTEQPNPGAPLRRKNTSMGSLSLKKQPGGGAGGGGGPPSRRKNATTGRLSSKASAALRRDLSPGPNSTTTKAELQKPKSLSPVRKNTSTGQLPSLSDPTATTSRSLSPVRRNRSAGELPTLGGGGGGSPKTRPGEGKKHPLQNHQWTGTGKDGSLSPDRSRSRSPTRGLSPGRNRSRSPTRGDQAGFRRAATTSLRLPKNEPRNRSPARLCKSEKGAPPQLGSLFGGAPSASSDKSPPRLGLEDASRAESMIFCKERGHFAARSEVEATKERSSSAERLSLEERAEKLLKAELAKLGLTDDSVGDSPKRGRDTKKASPKKDAAGTERRGRGNSSSRLPKGAESEPTAPRRRARSAGRLPKSDVEGDGVATIKKRHSESSKSPKRTGRLPKSANEGGVESSKSPKRRGRSTGRLPKGDDEVDGAAMQQQGDGQSPSTAKSGKSRRAKSTGKLPKSDDGGETSKSPKPRRGRSTGRLPSGDNDEGNSPKNSDEELARQGSGRARRRAKRAETMNNRDGKPSTCRSLSPRGGRHGSSKEPRLLDSTSPAVPAA